jgi:hypothetical protein
VRNLRASVTWRDAARLTAVERMPAVSQVSMLPEGGAGKMQARQAVGWNVRSEGVLAAGLSTAAAENAASGRDDKSLGAENAAPGRDEKSVGVENAASGRDDRSVGVENAASGRDEKSVGGLPAVRGRMFMVAA